MTRRAVLTHSANLHAKQSRGLDQTLATARRRLAELQARLARGRTRRDRAAEFRDTGLIRSDSTAGAAVGQAVSPPPGEEHRSAAAGKRAARGR